MSGSSSKPVGVHELAFGFNEVFEAAQNKKLEDHYLDYDSLRTLLTRLDQNIITEFNGNEATAAPDENENTANNLTNVVNNSNLTESSVTSSKVNNNNNNNNNVTIVTANTNTNDTNNNNNSNSNNNNMPSTKPNLKTQKSKRLVNEGALLDEIKRANRLAFFKALCKEMKKVASYYSTKMAKYDREFGFLHKESAQYNLSKLKVAMTPSGHYDVTPQRNKQQNSYQKHNNSKSSVPGSQSPIIDENEETRSFDFNENDTNNNNNTNTNTNTTNKNNNNSSKTAHSTSSQSSDTEQSSPRRKGSTNDNNNNNRRGSVDNSITFKKLRDALAMMNSLAIFWNLNEHGILAILNEYEYYMDDENVSKKLLKLTDEERTIWLKLTRNRSTPNNLSKLGDKHNNNNNNGHNISPQLTRKATNDSVTKQKRNSIVGYSANLFEKTLLKDGEKLLIAWEKWQKRKNKIKSNIELITDQISTLQDKIQSVYDLNNQSNSSLHHSHSNMAGVGDRKEDGSFIASSTDEDMNIYTVNEINLDSLDPGTMTQMWLEMVDGPLQPIKIPVIIAKGLTKGPVIGITAALHGNEVNGIQMLHQLFKELDIFDVSGTIVAIPVLNPPGFELRQREFNSRQDLNRLFPGKPNGNRGQIYVHAIQQKIFAKLNYLIDLHTASHGRENSLYVRADMNNSTVKKMALVQNPEIIVHNTAPDGSARAAAMNMGIPSITVEIGNPQRFQEKYITYALEGVRNVLALFHVVTEPIVPPSAICKICVKSEWSYVQHGGTLEVRPRLNEWVKKGQTVAIVRNIFGHLVYKYKADKDGIVIGRNIDPICQAGDRLLHIGFIGTAFPEGKVDDGHM